MICADSFALGTGTRRCVGVAIAPSRSRDVENNSVMADRSQRTSMLPIVAADASDCSAAAAIAMERPIEGKAS